MTGPSPTDTPPGPPPMDAPPGPSPMDAGTGAVAGGVTRPFSTYRVQIRPEFTLTATAGIAGYLAKLGASHLYSAPLLPATPGSEHGYDVVSYESAGPQLGGDDGLRSLHAALKARGLGLVVDIVPNHTGVAVPAVNPAWWDLLEHGRQSAYARWFDVDWSGGRLLIPVLADMGDPLSDLELVATADGQELRYFDHRFPVAPGTGEGTPREVHDRQHYELVNWRRGSGEINYRRFFAVTELAGLRVEDRAVFEATHRTIRRWYDEGLIDGIRVDHPDGLADPSGYLGWLHEAAPNAWLVVEKIAEAGESLPEWPIDGLTGYDALQAVCGVFVDPAGEEPFTTLDTELTGVETNWPDLAYACKREVATKMLLAELRRLVRLAPDVDGAEDALAELLACFPVYRSYLPFGVEHLEHAAVEAVRRNPSVTEALAALLPRLRDQADELALRFQQTSGAVMAKGVEDTAFYRWTRFIALNEVGGDPSLFGVYPAQFHEAAVARETHWPDGMTTLSTHDTKRGEDVRARLAVLAELPDGWSEAVRRWSAEAPLPDGAIAHLLWQTVIGSWPIEPKRLHAAMEKSAREARTATSWDQPDEIFEAAMHAVIDRLYDDQELSRDIDTIAAMLTPYGWINSLGQKLVQLTMPGVPDTYQGTELWDNSLVDPDNRRPVDFAANRELLELIDGGDIPPIDESGAAKLLVTARALRLRRDRPDLFTGYTPLPADGPAADHLLAFDRGGAITAATRLPVGLERAGGWSGTNLVVPEGTWTDILNNTTYHGGPVPLPTLLATYPISLLTRD